MELSNHNGIQWDLLWEFQWGFNFNVTTSSTAQGGGGSFRIGNL